MARPKLVLLWGLLVCAAGFLVSLNGCGGGSSGGSTTSLPTASITATPNVITAGQSITLAWQTTGATDISIQGLGTVPADGSQQVMPTASTAYTLTAKGSGGTQQATALVTVAANKISHVVVIFQENRSTDNLFQDPVLVQRGADIQNYGVNSHGQKVILTPVSLKIDYDLSHSHPSFLAMYDNGKMDGADLIPVGCNPKAPPTCPPPNPWFAYVNPSEVAPYFQLAETYTFGDRMFQTNQGPSFPAHQYIISGTSAPSVGSNLFAADNPLGSGAFNNAGCIAPPAETVALIDPSGDESQLVYPCFDHPTLTDELNTKTISWRYYSPNAGIIWNGPNAIQHICGPNLPPPNATACTGSDWTNNVVLQYTQVLSDIQNGQLATVSWVIPSGQASDHADITDGTGPSWVASVVNAIGNSQYWSDTAIFIAWDDWGGWYDHVPPKVINSYEYGFRVPLIVVSPYAKPAYVSHVTHDFGSILKYIEENFGLNSLGYADAKADDLSDCFDYNQTPLAFHTITAPLDGNHFLHDTSPPTDPDDD
jgi:phospholipase C